jgi:orotidine-5'-phosphate decarboxylase
VDIIVAYDKRTKRQIRSLIKPLRGLDGVWIKLGYIPMFGTDLRWLAKLGREYGVLLFLDAKLDDIPNTVGEATQIAAEQGFDAINVHASAGFNSIRAAVANKGDMLVFAVTVLTSIDPEECQSIFGDVPNEKVLQFTRMAQAAGVDGIICSPQEAKFLWQFDTIDFDNLLIWTPGIRSNDAPPDDQKRTMTAGEAAGYVSGMVIGRPIYGAADPVAAVAKFQEESAGASGY